VPIVLPRPPGTGLRPVPPVLKPPPGMILSDLAGKGMGHLAPPPEKPHTTVYVGKIAPTIEDEFLRAILEVSASTLYAFLVPYMLKFSLFYDPDCFAVESHSFSGYLLCSYVDRSRAGNVHKIPQLALQKGLGSVNLNQLKEFFVPYDL
jgi:hypothetical protein